MKLLLLFLPAIAMGEMFMGLRVAPEIPCKSYNRKKNFPYSASKMERAVVRKHGLMLPYTLRPIKSLKETDLEHLVAAKEAVDSGLCRRTRAEKVAFASDLDNLTIARPDVNRNGRPDKWSKNLPCLRKFAKDPSEWLPCRNKCWYVFTHMKVKKKYRLTIDRKEKRAIEKVVKHCKTKDILRR